MPALMVGLRKKSWEKEKKKEILFSKRAEDNNVYHLDIWLSTISTSFELNQSLDHKLLFILILSIHNLFISISWLDNFKDKSEGQFNNISMLHLSIFVC